MGYTVFIRYTGKKGKAWELVKQITRALSSDCYTCPARNLQGINAQAGHCWPVGHVGSNNKLSWDLKQIKLQCSRCNGAGQGEQKTFIDRLIMELGEKEVQILEARRWKTDPVKDWDALIEYYKEVLREIQENAPTNEGASSSEFIGRDV